MIVLPDADIEMAADAAVSAGYGSAGERCMAVSMVVAVGGVADELVAAIKERIPKVKVGNGLEPDSEMGPLVTKEHRDRVASYVERGFRAIKFGWGVFGRDLKLDLALVKAAREEAGPDIDLLVDAGWYDYSLARPYKPRSLKDWIRLVGELEELGIVWLEDFLDPTNVAGYAAVARHTRTLRLAAGEQSAGIEEFERLALEGQVDVLQPDLSRCGGLTVGRQIADFATRRQIDCVPHAWLTDLLKAASLHLNAYLMNSLYLEFNVSTASVLNQLCKEPIALTNGLIPIPTGPGLGVEVDEEVVRRYRV
jgi:L-alanine-DL-glutamate epimerase-like enolase superfamily enzyme